MFDQQGFYDKIIFQIFGQEIPIVETRLVAYGAVNQGVYLATHQANFFLKVSFKDKQDIFQKEAEGLNLMRVHCPLQIPEVHGFGRVDDRNFLLMDWIQEGQKSAVYWEELGVGLAHLHMATQPDFGLGSDNFIASIGQVNQEKPSWPDFFIQNRLEPLIGRAYFEGLVTHDFLKKFQKIYPLLTSVFPKERPALLHGDLWSGNVIQGKEGKPVLIDPAVYYGHREMDLAFSRLFGGFDESFYQSYEVVFPLEPGFQQRVPIYNLYPLLVHLLLFGKAYLVGIEKTVKTLLG